MMKIGQTESEKDAEQSLKCRQIVQEIIKFGISQAQIIKIIKLLALEIEDITVMKKIVGAIENKDLNIESETKKSIKIIT